jgi:hypothetical protein
VKVEVRLRDGRTLRLQAPALTPEERARLVRDALRRAGLASRLTAEVGPSGRVRVRPL